MDESVSVKKVKVKHHILHLLKMNGRQSAVDLAQQIEVSPMAIRQHLQSLQDEQLVTYVEQRQAVGRPLKFWYLTELAMNAFPDRHGDLTNSLLEGIVQVFGQSGLEDLIAERTHQQIEVYASKIHRNASWQEKIVTLAHLRTEEGYMAEAIEESPNVWLLRENHCSIATAAKTCSLFCNSEWKVFQALLGSEVKIERIEHLLNGDRCCAYRISLVSH
jgi:predicted ArsR family transcriptional regulator